MCEHRNMFFDKTHIKIQDYHSDTLKYEDGNVFAVFFSGEYLSDE